MGKITNKIFILVALLYLGSLTSGCQRASSRDYELVHSGRNWYGNLNWSPDGERIAFTLSPDPQFVILDLEDSQEISLPIDTEGIRGPRTMQWPTDGEISYSLSHIEPSERVNSVLARYTLDDEETYTLLSRSQIFQACWSGPTQSYALVTHTSTQRYHMYGNGLVVYNPEDESLVRLFRAVPPNGDVIDIACDQSQGRVAVVVKGGRSNRTWHSLIIFDMESQRSETIFETSQMSINSPTWSPEGDWIAIRNLHMRRNVPYRGIKLISANDGEVRTVMNPNRSFSPGELAWSPTDNRLLFSTPNGFRSYGLYLLDLTPWLEE